MVEFVSYDGKYPNLCAGTLVLRIDGDERTFLKHCLSSGGSVWFSDGYSESHIECGAWEIELPPDLETYRREIERCINDNIPHGCCGGCL